jgi:hypothetical protein
MTSLVSSPVALAGVKIKLLFGVAATGCSQDRKTPVMINLLVGVTARE